MADIFFYLDALSVMQSDEIQMLVAGVWCILIYILEFSIIIMHIIWLYIDIK